MPVHRPHPFCLLPVRSTHLRRSFRRPNRLTISLPKMWSIQLSTQLDCCDYIEDQLQEKLLTRRPALSEPVITLAVENNPNFHNVS
jgi:hypothetical protein